MRIVTLLIASFVITIFSLPAVADVIKGTVDGGKKLKKAAAVVYLADAKGELKQPDNNPTMDQRNMTFIPHVLAVQAGTTIDFLNNDEVRHNVFSPDKEKYNLGTWPTGGVKPRTFIHKGVYTQLCNVHPEMEAFIVVLDTPYFATTAKDGSFTINDVPPGEYTVKVWHEKMRFNKQKVNVPADGDATITVSRKKRR
jgi:plastocyanin